jgi:TonB family protein
MIGDFPGSENLYKRALAINEKNVGAESEAVAQSAFNLAEFYRFTNSYQKAEPLYRRALEIRDKNLKPDDETVKRTANRFRCLYYQSEQADKLKAFEESRAALYRLNNPSPPVDVINGKALSLPKPPYPPEAKSVRATGVIVIQVTIDESGKVVHAEDVCGGNSALIRVATEAAYQARFSRTLLSGVPVKVTGVITYRFAL